MSRYIDATDIAKQIADFKRVINSPNSDYMTGYLCALSVTEGMIANTDTADVVEVRHGRWGFDGLGWTCSECGEYALTDKAKMQVHSNYCPHCGAKMDGGKII